MGRSFICEWCAGLSCPDWVANEAGSDAENPLFVYDWRLEPERKMREEKGKGMSDEQVIRFVDGCSYRIPPLILSLY